MASSAQAVPGAASDALAQRERDHVAVALRRPPAAARSRSRDAAPPASPAPRPRRPDAGAQAKRLTPAVAAGARRAASPASPRHRLRRLRPGRHVVATTPSPDRATSGLPPAGAAPPLAAAACGQSRDQQSAISGSHAPSTAGDRRGSRDRGRRYTRRLVRLFHEHEQVVVCHDRDSGLRAIIAVHDTTLGPGLGGIRMWSVPQRRGGADRRAAAVGGDDLQELAGRARPGRRQDGRGGRSPHRQDAGRSSGRWAGSSTGWAAPTWPPRTSARPPTTPSRWRRRRATSPACRSSPGGSGDPSPMTAWGVVCGIRAALAEAGIGGRLRGRARRRAGRRPRRRRRRPPPAGGRGPGDGGRHLRGPGRRRCCELGAEQAPAETVHEVECDVYSPCALGAVIRPETIGRLRCRVIAGAANNQLADDVDGR